MASPITIQLDGDASGLRKTLASTEKRLSAFGTNAGKALKAVGIAAAGGIAVAGVGAAKLAFDLDSARAEVARATGATGDDLKALTDNLTDAFGQVPDSLETVAVVLGDVRTRFTGSNEDVEALTVSMLDFARVTGGDAAATAEGLGRAMQAWGVDAATADLDVLTRVTQDFGIAGDALASQMQSFGPVFANAGFSMDQTATIMGRLHGAGQDITRISPGINAFFRRMADAGREPIPALREVEAAIRGAETRSEALKIATDAFGAEGAQRLTTAIRSVGVSFGNLDGYIAGADGTLQQTTQATATFGDQLSELGNKIKTEVADKVLPVMDRIVSSILENWDAWSEAIGSVWNKVEALAAALRPLTNLLKNNLAPALTALSVVLGAVLVAKIHALTVAVAAKAAAWWAVAAAVIAANAPLYAIVAAIAALAAGLVWAYQNSETFRTVVHAAFDAVKRTVGEAVNVILGYIDHWLTALEKIAGAAAWLADKVGINMDGVVGAIGAARDFIADAQDGIADAFSSIGDAAEESAAAVKWSAEESAAAVKRSAEQQRREIELLQQRASRYAADQRQLARKAAIAAADITKWSADEQRTALESHYRGLDQLHNAHVAAQLRRRQNLHETVFRLDADAQRLQHIAARDGLSEAEKYLKELEFANVKTWTTVADAAKGGASKVADAVKGGASKVLSESERLSRGLLVTMVNACGTVTGFKQCVDGMVVEFDADMNRIADAAEELASGIAVPMVNACGTVTGFKQCVDGMVVEFDADMNRIVDSAEDMADRVGGLFAEAARQMSGSQWDARFAALGITDPGQQASYIAAARDPNSAINDPRGYWQRVRDRYTAKSIDTSRVDEILAGIPAMAGGGLVTRPTLALIGEAGPEAVVPLPSPRPGSCSCSAPVVHVNINGDFHGDEDRFAELVVDGLRTYVRRNGPLDLAVG